MVRILFHCEWCDELIEEEYIVLWRIVDGRKVDETFLHWICEEDFKADAGKKGWREKTFEADPEIYIDPVITAWKAKQKG